jgi:hypothetical protein
VDVDYARRIAHLATQQQYGYWLDVEDPLLQHANGSAVPSPAKEILIASIIEMALLNSSHVIAAMTGNTSGSKWVPYELGRAKQRMVFSRRSATWVHLGQIKITDCGEYIRLAEVTATEQEILTWLQSSRLFDQVAFCVMPSSPSKVLGPTHPLP